MSFEFYTVPNTHFAPGCSAGLIDVARKLGISKPLFVTDSGVFDQGLLEPTINILNQLGIDFVVFSDVQADPPEDNILAAVKSARENACDGVIGFGGGSSMDVAKLVAALLGSTQALSDIYGVEQLTGQRFPLVQVPTTAGTGSEVTHVAIVTTGESTKAGVVSRVLFADAIILDPELTVGLPPLATASTGIDAMVHAIEAYTSKRLKNPLSDMLALKSLSLMSSSIEAAVENGGNMDARSDMLLGAMLAGQAFANSPVGAVHALAYPLGGIYHIPHGLSNSLVLPHVLRFNAPKAEHLYAQLMPQILPGIDIVNPSEQLASHFLQLAEKLGLEVRLSQLGIPLSALETLAEQAMLQERLLINNPRVISYDQALDIYQQAY